MELVNFGSKDIGNDLARMSDDQLDSLAYGAIQLDKNGRVLRYNATEGEICDRDPKSMIGQNFFTEVAPCTNTKGFRGRFEEGVQSGDLNTLFSYTFDYNMAPTKVRIHMKNSTLDDTYWVIVKRV